MEGNHPPGTAGGDVTVGCDGERAACDTCLPAVSQQACAGCLASGLQKSESRVEVSSPTCGRARVTLPDKRRSIRDRAVEAVHALAQQVLSDSVIEDGREGLYPPRRGGG